MSTARHAKAAGVVAALFALGACGTNTGPSAAVDTDTDASVSETRYLDVTGPLESASLSEVVKGADKVAMGTVIGYVDDVAVDKSGASYRVYEIRATDTFKGEGPLNFSVAMMTHGPDGTPVYFEGRPTPRDGDEVLWMLSVYDSAADQYVLSNSASAIAFDDGGRVVNHNHHMPLLAAAEELGTRDAVVEAIEQAVR